MLLRVLCSSTDLRVMAPNVPHHHNFHKSTRATPSSGPFLDTKISDISQTTHQIRDSALDSSPHIFMSGFHPLLSANHGDVAAVLMRYSLIFFFRNPRFSHLDLPFRPQDHLQLLLNPAYRIVGMIEYATTVFVVGM